MCESQTSPRYNWRESRKKYQFMTKYYTDFLSMQKRHVAVSQTLHESANYLFLTESQKQCLSKMKDAIKESKHNPQTVILEAAAGCGIFIHLLCSISSKNLKIF